MRISDWSSDVCSSDLAFQGLGFHGNAKHRQPCHRGRHARQMGRAARARDYYFQASLNGGTRIVVKALWCAMCRHHLQIGRASCRERVCQYVWISVDAVSLKKKYNKKLIYMNNK